MPPSIILVTALVFVITAGEIDLAFPAIIGAGGAGFAGFWTEFIFGIVIIVTMVVHRFSGHRLS